jgi:hypothetical protein
MTDSGRQSLSQEREDALAEAMRREMAEQRAARLRHAAERREAQMRRARQKLQPRNRGGENDES